MIQSRIRPLGPAFLAIALTIAACGGPAGPPSPPAPAPSIVLDGETIEMASWRVGTGTFDCRDLLIRSASTVEVRYGVGTTTRGDDVVVVQPAEDWNGDAIVFAHGYRDPASAAGFWSGTPGSLDEVLDDLAAGDGAAGVAAILPLAICPLSDALTPGLGLGKPSVAFAASSYSENGFALTVAPFETRAAAAWLDELLGPADRRFLIGASLGGAVVVDIAEENPDAFEAGIPMCGPVDGTLMQTDYVGHAELAFRTLYPDAFDGGSPPSDLDTPVDELAGIPFDGAPDSVVGRIAAALKPADTVDETLGAYTVQYEGSTERLPLIPYDPADPDTLIESFTEVFYFATAGKRDLVARAGGLPFDNQGVTYRDGSDALVDLATITADAAVRDAARSLFDPSGTPGIPLHLLHNQWDPIVPSFHSEAYGDRVGLGPDLIVTIVDDTSSFADDGLGAFASGAYGHCRFPGETLQAFNALSQP